MALPLKLLAAIGTAGVAISGVAYVAFGAQSAPAKDPEVVVCDGIDVRDPRVPPEVLEKCAKAKAKNPALPPQGSALGGSALVQGRKPCESCAPSDDPFRDPWLIGPASASAAASGNSRLSTSALADLEARIRNLENTSYFEVVSQKTEKTIFRVGPGGARFFDEAGVAVAAVGTSEAGGFFSGRSASGVEASIGASGRRAGVRIFDSGLPRTELGTNEGPYALRFPGGNGLIAGLGESRSGSGAVLVGTVPGVTEGAIIVSDGRPMVSLTKGTDPGGMVFAEATIGGGFAHVVMARGESAVKMGHNGHRYGIVLTGPILGVPYVPRTGIAGSYFMGCASGEKPACLPEVAEQ
jgi:hypothetical protein